VCGKSGHTAIKCWHRFDETYQEEKIAGSATTSYGVDTNWYVDLGSTDHITGELDKLSMCERYNGQDQVHVANGSGMMIRHVGQSVISTPDRNLHLNNILHVPSANKNLISVHRLATDNQAFLEFHPDFFVIKDQATKKVIHSGKCEGGLYPLVSSEVTHNKQAYGATRLSLEKWHCRLAHASFPIVHRVLKNCQLPCFFNSSTETVCDSCQCAKSHQLPYPKSTSVSAAPFALVFSDVWGPAPTSVGRHDYYVSFIDDFSKYTWIYLLKKKSDVFSSL